MVELRKRPPPKEPPAPAPAAKRSASASKVSKPPPKKQSGVAAKAKAAAGKVKDVVAGIGPNEGESSIANKQPNVENAPGSESIAPIEKGEASMIPETVATAPSSVTEPARPAAAAAPEPAATRPAGRVARGRGKAPVAAAVPTAAEPKAVDEPIPAPTEAVASTTTAEPATVPSEEDRPPATDDLEHPPETGKVEAANESSAAPATSATDTTTLATATLPLSASSVGLQIPNVSSFGGELETHTGQRVSVSSLLAEAATGGIIVFTYPKASTPGCTTQACSFRDNHEAFTGASGYKVFGLSTDSTKANTTFATKQGLPFPLLCDTAGALTGALGMKKGGSAKGTLRGVVVVDGRGVVKVWFQGGPGATVERVREYIATVGK